MGLLQGQLNHFALEIMGVHDIADGRIESVFRFCFHQDGMIEDRPLTVFPLNG